MKASEWKRTEETGRVPFIRRHSDCVGILVLIFGSLLLSGTAQQARAQNFTILHKFTGRPRDGAYPLYDGLIMDADGNLYGTTRQGGDYDEGTVFELVRSSNYSETVLHMFSYNDGSYPEAGLIMDSSGNLYGTTLQGGVYGDGTVFKLDSTGNLTVLHSFTNNGGDGWYPEGRLIMDSSGKLFGTTLFGGANYGGTVFEVDPGANPPTETVLHSFGGSDGRELYAGLIMDSSGNLYGTSLAGGDYDYGTVFELLKSSGYSETVLHSFNYTDGGYPIGGLLRDSSGNLFGTAGVGGAYTLGTVFKLDPNTTPPTVTVLHNFNRSDGEGPIDRLVMDSSGNLYGTTVIGGDYYDGTVFELVKSSGYSETVLHSFNYKTGDGAGPYAGLIRDPSGNLFGITRQGGDTSLNSGYGIGTVFALLRNLPFATFTGSLEITGILQATFQMSANFTLGAGNDGINPPAEPVTLQMGTFILTIPSGSFSLDNQGNYVFSGIVDGVSVNARIAPLGADAYSIQVEGVKANMAGVTSPVPVILTIGNDSGATTM